MKEWVWRIVYFINKINVPLILLACVPILGEIHQFWKDDTRQSDVFLFVDFKLWNEWIVCQVCEMIQYSTVCYFLYSVSKKSRISSQLKKVFLAIFIQSFLDIPMYFLTYRNAYYSTVLYIVAIFLVFTFPSNKKKA
jgi:hypothetical protein